MSLPKAAMDTEIEQTIIAYFGRGPITVVTGPVLEKEIIDGVLNETPRVWLRHEGKLIHFTGAGGRSAEIGHVLRCYWAAGRPAFVQNLTTGKEQFSLVGIGLVYPVIIAFFLSMLSFFAGIMSMLPFIAAMLAAALFLVIAALGFIPISRNFALERIVRERRERGVRPAPVESESPPKSVPN